MALTITIPGAVETTTGSTAPAVLTVGVGAPGQGVPSGGTTGQVLQKLSGVSYDTGWLTLPADFITSVTSPLAVATGVLSVDLSAYLTSATAASTYQTLAGMSSYLTTATAASTYYLQTNPSGFQTAANVTTALSPYLLSATAASTYAPIAAGQPTAGTTGQVLTKNSGTNYDSSWATLIPGDRYLTTSTTSNTISNNNKTFTIGTGLAYTPTQNITISFDASNHMHGEVLTYNSGTGVLTVDINHHTGSGTYAAWVVNVGGVTPATSVAFSDITGAVSGNVNLQAALDLKSDLASPTFTGAPTLPTGSIGVTQSPGNNTTALATTAFVTAAVPLVATFAESRQLTSTTAFMSPFDTITAMMAEGYRPALSLTTATSGTGASASQSTLAYVQLVGPNVLTAGYAIATTNIYSALAAPSNPVTLKFNKPIWISGLYASFDTSYRGDANTETKAYLGINMGNGNDPTSAAIGWFKQGGTSTPFQVMVHDGTTLTKVASATSTANSVVPFRWMVYSDGAGNVTLYIDGVSVATTALGPTGATQANISQFTAAVKANVTAATRMVHEIYYPKIYVAPQ